MPFCARMRATQLAPLTLPSACPYFLFSCAYLLLLAASLEKQVTQLKMARSGSEVRQHFCDNDKLGIDTCIQRKLQRMLMFWRVLATVRSF